VSGSEVWVANNGNNTGSGTVTVLNVSNGSLVRIIDSQRDESPGAVAINGTHVWIANDGLDIGSDGNVTELNASNGSLVRVVH